MSSVPNEAKEVKPDSGEQVSTQLARRERSFTLMPENLKEAMDFSQLIAVSELCPKEYRGKAPSVLIAVMMGAELGVSPMQSLQNIAVINGRPTMWGDLVLALVQASGVLEFMQERDAQEAGAKKEGRCEVRRRGVAEPIIRTFSLDMAEKAGLTSRGGPDAPWSRYTGRMLQMRARSWALRDGFADVLKGLQTREEVEDYPDGQTIDMPRRASDVTQADIARFTGTPALASAPAGAATGGQASVTSANVWIGKVSGVKVKSGETNGKKWTLQIVTGEDGGEFSSFSEEHANFARAAGKLPIEIRFEQQSGGGRRKILSIGPGKAQDREPGEDGDL